MLPELPLPDVPAVAPVEPAPLVDEPGVEPAVAPDGVEPVLPGAPLALDPLSPMWALVSMN